MVLTRTLHKFDRGKCIKKNVPPPLADGVYSIATHKQSVFQSLKLVKEV